MKIIKYQLMTEIVHETVVPVELVDENGELVYEEVPVLDEDGQPMFDEDGNPITELKVVIVYEPDQEIEQIFYDKTIECPDAAFETMLAVAKAEAYNGEVTVVDGPPDPEPETPSEDSVWDELDAAYQRGVDSV